MQIVIKIPEELYKHIKNDNVYYLEDGEELYTIVKNGNQIEKVVENSLTIIEAESKEAEDDGTREKID